LGGTPPKPPWVGFAEIGAIKPFAKQNKRFLLLFLEKKNTSVSYEVDFGGHAPQTPLGGFTEVWVYKPSAKQNKRFLLLFLEKEEYYTTNSPSLPF
jgi:hypothetical protein